LIVNKYEINNIPKCTPLWHEMFEIASVSQTPLVGSGFFTFNMSHYLKSLKICPDGETNKVVVKTVQNTIYV